MGVFYFMLASRDCHTPLRALAKPHFAYVYMIVIPSEAAKSKESRA